MAVPHTQFQTSVLGFEHNFAKRGHSNGGDTFTLLVACVGTYQTQLGVAAIEPTRTCKQGPCTDPQVPTTTVHKHRQLFRAISTQVFLLFEDTATW